MKKVYYIVVFIIIAMIFVSCNQRTNIPANNNEVYTENSSAPTIVTFSSIADIEEFVSAATGTTIQYDSFVSKQTFGNYVTHDTAKDIASNIKSSIVPIIKKGVLIEDFGGTYYAERSELNLYYWINGIRYAFVYTFNATEPHKYEGKPVLNSVLFGSTSLDLYQGEKCFVGSMMQGTTAIRVIVYTEQPDEIDLSCFEFCEI